MRVTILLLLMTGYHATAQTKLWRISEEKRAGSVVSLLAENLGYVPITIRLQAELTNMVSSAPLPVRLVVYPNKNPQLLAKFTPGRGPNYSYHYYPTVDLGIADGKQPDSTYVYGLPFGKGVAWHWLPTNPVEDKIPPGSYPYFFVLPDNSSVCAARPGVVAQFYDESKRSNQAPTNFIIIFHDDGSYGWYQFLKQKSVVVKLGQRVTKGELLGFSSAEKKPLPLWFTLLYPGQEAAQEVPIRFEGVTDYGGFKTR